MVSQLKIYKIMVFIFLSCFNAKGRILEFSLFFQNGLLNDAPYLLLSNRKSDFVYQPNEFKMQNN